MVSRHPYRPSRSVTQPVRIVSKGCTYVRHLLTEAGSRLSELSGVVTIHEFDVIGVAVTEEHVERWLFVFEIYLEQQSESFMDVKGLGFYVFIHLGVKLVVVRYNSAETCLEDFELLLRLLD